MSLRPHKCIHHNVPKNIKNNNNNINLRTYIKYPRYNNQISIMIYCNRTREILYGGWILTLFT